MRHPAAIPRLPLRRRLPVMEAALGAIAAMGLEPFGFWPATPVAFGLALWHIARAPSARRAGVEALAFGMGWFGLALHWIVEPFFIQPEVHGWMAPFALVLMALGGGLFWAVPAWVACRLVHHWQRRVAAIALGWLLAEWLRGILFTGFPWAQPGQVWADTAVAQLAAFGGQLGLTALTLALASLPSLRWRPARPPLNGIGPGLGAAIALLVLVWIAGLLRLNGAETAPQGVTLRLVQPDAAQALKWDPDWAAEFWRRLLALSAGPTADGGRPDAVIWPETAVSFLLNDAGPALPLIAEAAGGAPVLTGIQRADGLRYYNSLVEITPEAQVGAVYDKFHLVPFGEYIPAGDRLADLGIGAFAARAGMGYSKGPGPAVMQVGDLPPFQPLICYEAIFPRHLRNAPSAASWTLQVTNDAWFGRFSGPYQHLAQARLRAIETGRPLVRVANTGISAVIDARGRVLDSIGLDRMGRIDAALPGALPRTPWLRAGDAPLLVVTLLSFAALVLRDRRRRIDAAHAGP